MREESIQLAIDELQSSPTDELQSSPTDELQSSPTVVTFENENNWINMMQEELYRQTGRRDKWRFISRSLRTEGAPEMYNAKVFFIHEGISGFEMEESDYYTSKKKARQDAALIAYAWLKSSKDCKLTSMV